MRAFHPKYVLEVVLEKRVIWVREEDSALTFGNTSALYESDMVMLDYHAGGYWRYAPSEAIVGPHGGLGV